MSKYEKNINDNIKKTDLHFIINKFFIFPTGINNNEISHKAILNEFEKSRNKSIEQYDHILVNIAGIKEIFRQEILDLEKDMTNRIDILSKRTTLNEKWRWTMVGAGAVIIFIVEVLARSKVFPFLN